ncbi:TlpA disulfide reductase family protein [Mycolicibacterium sp. A43C]
MTDSPLTSEVFDLEVSEWVNSDPIDIAALRGRVIVIEAFQMLCPGCVSHGIPLAQRIHRAFDRDNVTVIGLHTVFEHHDVMGPDALRVFLAEYRIDFPVAIDSPIPGHAIPATMQRYGLRGTPSTLILDRRGRLRHKAFGAVDDLVVGVLIGQLLTESTLVPTSVVDERGAPSCNIDGSCT